MRFIHKPGIHNRTLDRANSTPPASGDEARRRWTSFSDKTNLQQQLLDEQYHLCCYSELRADLEGIGYHIEHVQPKSQFPELTFEYRNLTASAVHSDELSQLAGEVFGGHAKRSQYDAALFTSCLQADCARYFRYLSDGRVVPAQGLDVTDQARAQYTIDLLNLNSPYLVTHRQKWWDELETLFEEHIANDMSLHYLAAVDLLPRNQKLSPFFSVTRQFFGRIAEDVLAQEAPELV